MLQFSSASSFSSFKYMCTTAILKTYCRTSIQIEEPKTLSSSFILRRIDHGKNAIWTRRQHSNGTERFPSSNCHNSQQFRMVQLDKRVLHRHRRWLSDRSF